MNLDEASFFKRYMVAQTLTTVVGTFCYPIDTIKRRMMIQVCKAKTMQLSLLHFSRQVKSLTL